jgi:hypothetical protein
MLIHLIDGDELLVDSNTFDLWFDKETVCAEMRTINVSRQTAVIAIEYLTTVMLKKYCWDIEHGNNPGAPGSCIYSWVRFFDDNPLPGPHHLPWEPDCKSAEELGFPLIEDWNLFITNLESEITDIGGTLAEGCNILGGIYTPSHYCD